MFESNSIVTVLLYRSAIMRTYLALFLIHILTATVLGAAMPVDPELPAEAQSENPDQNGFLG
ncbi:hypothetical protein EI94DRAFT_1797381 [Lactarius quietus]|nr:hypothetical protein EI94DRAFT_1797381 [Lactarius quietus]